MNKCARAILVLGLLVILRVDSVRAGVELGFVPQPSGPGQLAVNIVISGLNAGGPPSVGAFDLDVSFHPAVLSPLSVTFGPFLGNPTLFEALTDFKFLPGVVDLAEVSILLPEQLDALQPASFPLAALSFARVGSGDGALSFTQIVVDDAFGGKIAIPAPPTWLLLAGALLGGVALRIGRQRLARFYVVKDERTEPPSLGSVRKEG